MVDAIDGSMDDRWVRRRGEEMNYNGKTAVDLTGGDIDESTRIVGNALLQRN